MMKYLFVKILKWGAVSICVAFAALVVYRMFYLRNAEKTQEQVAKIHATKLTLDDVMGKNLPPDPGDLADKTVQGIDANGNGIRDDVELAIFKEYPNSAKTRAVLLQYALALQMEVIQPIVNTGTVTAVIEKKARAAGCVADTLVPRKSLESPREYSDLEKMNSYTDFIERQQFNTPIRKHTLANFRQHTGSFELQSDCDIDPTNFSN